VADLGPDPLIPWVIKPLYGLLSDFVPLLRRRGDRATYLLTSAVAGLAGLLLAWATGSRRGQIWTFDLFGLTFTVIEGVGLFTVMALGLAFTDVLTDAMMVESGRPLGLTGSFQSVQWACITLASVLVGEIGGQMAETRSLRAALLLAACFPLVSLTMGVSFRARDARAREPRRLSRNVAGDLGRAQIRGRAGSWRVHLLLLVQSVLRGPRSSTTRPTPSNSASSHRPARRPGFHNGRHGCVAIRARCPGGVPLKRIMHLSIALGTGDDGSGISSTRPGLAA